MVVFEKKIGVSRPIKSIEIHVRIVNEWFLRDTFILFS